MSDVRPGEKSKVPVNQVPDGSGGGSGARGCSGLSSFCTDNTPEEEYATERILSLSHPRGDVSADDEAGEQDDDVGSEGQMKCARGKSGRGRDFWHPTPVSHLDTRRICRN